MDYYDIFSLQVIIWEIDKAIICGKLEKLLDIKKLHENNLSTEIIEKIELWINILTEKKNK